MSIAATTYDKHEAQILMIADGASHQEAARATGGATSISGWLSKRAITTAALRAVGPDPDRLRALCDRDVIKRPSEPGTVHKAKPKLKPDPKQFLDRRSQKALEELRRGALPLTVARMVGLDLARVTELRAAWQRGEYRNV
ncbi:hypothetical protein FDP22_12525 [Paroceanicella profunda]|uniref:Uncharacterized protein n=1 Tax=Paroceanicella profunda TaxID=2579971 RepID=A0A5B8G0G4_9RHOB|nr:hypothetical protein [Paroceanicella profunda]QDL92532.1 hypothetical protein FDP22_12525 [Paroceanicella profunda]